MADSSSTDVSLTFEALSALADGQADGAQTAKVLEAWRSDPQFFAKWQAYHVAGDAMRSDVPLVSLSSDAAFIGRLNERLANEPVVFAPAALLPSKVVDNQAPTRYWAKPFAIAASFVAIMGGLLGLLQGGLPGLSSNNEQLAGVGDASRASTALARGLSQQANTHGKPWPVDSNWTTALAADFSPSSGHAPDGVSRISFEAAAPTRTMSQHAASNVVAYAVASREEQLDAFWDQMRAQQAQERGLSMGSGAMVPVAFSPSAP